MGEAGTAARFLTAAASLVRGPVELCAGTRMSVRPMQPLLDALGSLGVQIDSDSRRTTFPCTLNGYGLHGGKLSLRTDVSSQFLTALLMIGPLLRGGLEIECAGKLVSRPYVDLTLQVMREFGCDVQEEEGSRRFLVPESGYWAADLEIPPDASSALFVFAAAAITDGSVSVPGLDDQWSQADLEALAVLESAGCAVERESGSTRCTGAPARGFDADLSRCPDAAPALAAIAATAPGPCVLRGLSTLPWKESDRLQTIAAGLRALGADAETTRDTLTIQPRPLHGGEIDPDDDHRIAMAFAVLGLKVPGVRVCNAFCVTKSWPGFWNLIEEIHRTSG